MTLGGLIRLALTASILLLVFALGLRATIADAAYVLRRPVLILRGFLAMGVIVPAAAAAVAALFELHPAVEIALLAMAVGPVPPILPSKQLSVARLRLQLVPTHPDLAGGLGYLAVAQSHFEVLCLAFAAVAAGTHAERMVFAGASLKAFTAPMLGLVLLNLLLYLGPLLCFGPRLVAVKRRGLREYGAVATAYVQGFDAKWLRGGAAPGESLLGSGDIQSLNDLAGGFDVIRRMRVVPFGLALVLILVVATLLPMAPLLFLAFPLDELLALAAKLVLGG